MDVWLSEVSFLTGDVVRLANFYRALLGVEGDCDDAVHQTIIAEETMLTIYDDGTPKNNQNENLCVAFTVDDVDVEYRRMQALGADVVEPPQTRPWGARNMCLRDPDGNRVYLRQLLADKA